MPSAVVEDVFSSVFIATEEQFSCASFFRGFFGEADLKAVFLSY